MTAGAGARVWRSLALVASVLVLLGIVGMHMLAGGHGAGAGAGHGATSGMSAAATESVGHGGHGPELAARAVDEAKCGHQRAGHEECVLSLPWSALPATTPPATWQPIWLSSRPAAAMITPLIEALARSSPLLLLLLCVCRT